KGARDPRSRPAQRRRASIGWDETFALESRRRVMPIATPDQYAEMLEKAKSRGFAYPAINVSSSQTVNAVLQGLTEAGSDGILQVSTGGADYFAGQSVKARAAGALAFAAFTRE